MCVVKRVWPVPMLGTCQDQGYGVDELTSDFDGYVKEFSK